MIERPHTLKVFDEEVVELRAMVCEMGGRAEAAIADAVHALVEGDEDRAQQVIGLDRKIDDLGAEIEQQAIKLIALRAPLADDLREVLGAFKISHLVARMGDCAKNIAHRASIIGTSPRLDQLRSIARMNAAVGEVVKMSIDSFATRDPDAAARIRAMDAQVEEYCRCIFGSLVEQMTDQPSTIGTAAQLLLVAQKLERIADQATAVSEIVRFMVLGTHAADPPEPSEPSPEGVHP